MYSSKQVRDLYPFDFKIDTEYYIDERYLWLLAICQLYNMGGANL